MILVDSCVLIDSLRTNSKKLDHLFLTLPVCTCGVVRAEILRGVRTVQERRQLHVFLARFTLVPMAEYVWDTVGDHMSHYRSRGLAITLNDAILATLAIEAGLELWTRDAHFVQMQAALPGLVLYAEPP